MELLSIEIANKDTLKIFFDSSLSENWEPGLEDYHVFASVDPSGFFIGKIEENIVGCISAVKYDKSFGFIGYYIVRKEYRGNGYGLKLFKHALKYLEGCNIGLDAVTEQIPNYINSGFFTTHQHIRFQGKGLRPLSVSSISVYLIQLSDCSLDQIKQFDINYFPASRDILLEKWKSMTEFTSIAYVERDEIKGYGVSRKSVNGFRIGPIYAKNSLIASHILQYLRTSIGENETFFIDVPNINNEAMNSMKSDLQLQEVFVCTRMYNNHIINIDWNGIYAVSSLEIG